MYVCKLQTEKHISIGFVCERKKNYIVYVPVTPEVTGDQILVYENQ